MKTLETWRECLGALERERSARKHLSKRKLPGSTIARERERGESLRERSQVEVCKMKGEGHLYIGGVPKVLHKRC